jgi:hypothetical protein
MSDVSFNIYLIIVLSKVLILFGLFSIWIVWFILHFQLAQCGGTFLFSIRPSYSGRYAYCEMLHLWKAACQPCWAWTRLLQFFSFHFRDIAAAYTWQQCTYTTVDFWIGSTSMRISFILQNLISLHFWSNSMCCLLLRTYVLGLSMLYCRELGAIGMDGMYCRHSFIDDSAFLVSYIS